MCGYIPVAIMLMCAKKMGAKKSELIKYCDSGDVSGDTEQVVGYAGVIVS
ncbi:MAG: AmmeMemoRadiSam system protein B [Candidatus Omnitrophota bacterium]